MLIYKYLTPFSRATFSLIDYKEVKKEVFFNRIGMTSANFRGKAKVTPLNSNAIVNILTTFPDLNPEWLLTGKGLMLRPVEAHREAPKALGNPQAVYELHEAKLATCVACDEKERVIQGFESQLQEVRHRLVDKDKQIESLERQIEGLKAGFENQIEDLKNNLGMVISEKSEVIKMKDAMLAMKEEAIKGKEVMLAAKDEIISIQSRRISELEDNKEAEDLKKILGTSERIGQESTSLTDIHPKDLSTKAKKGEYKV